MKEYTVRVSENGSKAWYLQDKLHREDGPAIERADGSKFWFLNGQRHREDGPAIEWADGIKQWFLNGQRLTEEEHKRRTTVPTMDDALAAGDPRLIAAAPELLEALEFLVAAASGEGPPVPERELLQDCVDKARTALAKAKGEEE